MRIFFFFSSRRRHTSYWRDWSSDVCSSDLSEQHGRGAVGEEARGDQVASGAVAALESEAGELDGDEKDQLVRVQTGVLRGAGEARRAGGATEAPDRDAARVLGEAEPEDEFRVQGWGRNAGGRDEEDRAHVLRPGPDPIEGPARGLLREVEGVLDVEGVLLGE